MESEGQPYKVSLHDECIYIEGPRPSLDSGCSIRIDPGMGDVAKVDAIQEGLDLAYAEGRKSVQIKTPCPSCGFTTLCVDDSGNLVCSFLECKNPTEIANKECRKSAEKEFKELLEIAQSLDDDTGYESAATESFRAWKKARGIA